MHLVADADRLFAVPLEDFVTERVRAGHTIIGLYPATDEKNLEVFAEWRKANGR